ncbi:unnamed protein product [Lactuca saligna]|uniref:Uncharacterized protein n=1 Tax=Lactuca saligna TaxID=75948 RepID=A0AA35VLL0_LACSI|nr:unnamed protein product [Lactuca saligna]
MRITRTTSFKSKFKNIVETTLNLEDEVDDFVADPEGACHQNKKRAILRMGFGSILQVSITSYPGQLSYYLLDVYDADSRRLVLQNFVIEITEQTVHDMMGLLIGKEDINELPLCDKGNQILEEWRGQYTCDKFNGEEYLRRIQATSKDSLIFRLNFFDSFR